MAKGTPRWASWELAYLQEHYGSEHTTSITAHLGRTERAVYEKARKLGLRSGLRYADRPPITYFQRIDTPAKAYVLGLLVADGWVDDRDYVNIDLTEADASAVAFIRDEIEPSEPLRIYRRNNSPRRRVRFRVRNADLAADLARHGVVPRKTGIESWPAELPAEYENSFICGYFDGDGHLDALPRPYWHLVSAARPFLEIIQERIRTATGASTFGPYRQASIWAIAKTGEPARIIDAWIHRDVPGLARKNLVEVMTGISPVTALPPRVAQVLHALMACTADMGALARLTATEVHGYDIGAVTRQSTGTALAFARKLGLADHRRCGHDGIKVWWATDKAWEMRQELENRILSEQETGQGREIA